MDSTVPIRLVLGGGSLLNQVARELSTALERQLAPLEVTSQQAALLLNAAGARTSPNQLAAKLGTDTAGMTRLLDRLSDKGLLVRRGNPEDRRSVVIELTGKGKALVPRLGPCFGRVTGRLLDGFTGQEIEQLTALLGRMLDNLGAGRAE